MKAKPLQQKRLTRVALFFLVLITGMMKSLAQPEGALSGLFSVSATKQVYFSQGNLQKQYQASTETWQFVENQWDYYGNNHDLFNWKVNSYWGSIAISNGGNQTNLWRMLTKNEWEYVINTRQTQSGIRYARAKVNNVEGFILLPDDWRASYYPLTHTNSWVFGYNNISASQWNTLEQHGAVFLPASGYHNGTSFYNIGYCGYYWSSSTSNSSNAYNFFFEQEIVGIGSYDRSTRQSVRLVCDAYTITATANPSAGGTITGAGAYYENGTCTLTATANTNYTFVNWTKNGSQVSTSPTYSFTVSGNASYVANFTLNSYEVTASANPAMGGTISGSGTYNHGATCTLTAAANEGYMFINWTKNGDVVSNVSNYSFYVTESVEYVAHFEPISGSIIIGSGVATNNYLPSHSLYNYALSQQIYTADEIGVAGTIKSIAFYNGGAEETRVYDMYMVLTDKTVFNGNKDWIAVTEADKVFSGTAQMVANSWTFFTLDTPFEYDGTSNLVLVMDDNSGSYTSSPHMACRVYNANGNQAIHVNGYGTNYDPSSPTGYSGTRRTVKNHLILGITSPTVAHTITLSQGWNWISTYVDLNEVDGIAMLEAALGDYGVTIQTNNESADYFGGGEWVGLEDYVWTNAEMVMVEVTEDCTITLAGPTVASGTVEIEINPGWNWIGFPVATETAIEVAMGGFEPEEEDAIQSNVEGTSDYLGEWVGDVLTLVPGQGYMYYSNSTEPKTLVFSTTAGGKSVFLLKQKE